MNAAAIIARRPTLDLSIIREQALDGLDRLRDRGGPAGCYRSGAGLRPDLYASLDVAIARAIMGENLATTLPSREREEWVAALVRELS